MSLPTKEQIRQACNVFNQSTALAIEADGKICKITMINQPLIDEFGPGYYKGSFVILQNHFRIIYFGHCDPMPLRVEECNPDGNYNKLFDELSGAGIYIPLHDFLWTYWPEGIYHIEKYLMDKE